MKSYYGNYLGLCINNADPEYRGRVQIFIPHIMPTLYEKWNQEGKDINIQGVGDNVANGLSSDVIDKLVKILPWAESASPIMAASSSGTLTSSLVQGVTTGFNSLVQSAKKLFNQTPVQVPSTSAPGSAPAAKEQVGALDPQQANPLGSTNQSTIDSTKTGFRDPSVSYTDNIKSIFANATTVLDKAKTTKFTFGTDSTGNINYGDPDSNNEKSLKIGLKYNIQNTNTGYGTGGKQNLGPGAIAVPANSPFKLGDIIVSNTGTVGQVVDVSGNTITPNGPLNPANVDVWQPPGTYSSVYNNAQNTPSQWAKIDSASVPTTNEAIQSNLINKYSQYGTITGGGPGPSAAAYIKAGNGTYIGYPDGAPYKPVNCNTQVVCDPHGPTTIYNHNNTTKGMFSYPEPGAMLWVFFQEGNPLFPVYFAANYGASEWQSAYKNHSPGAGYANTPTVKSSGVVYNTGVGGFRSEDTTHTTDSTKNQKSFMVYGNDGSNMFFNDGYHQIFSKFDRRDQVEGDRFQSTLGYKEELVQGTNSHTTTGDIVIRVGNISQEAIDAVTNIQKYQVEAHTPLTQSS